MLVLLRDRTPIRAHCERLDSMTNGSRTDPESAAQTVHGGHACPPILPLNAASASVGHDLISRPYLFHSRPSDQFRNCWSCANVVLRPRVVNSAVGVLPGRGFGLVAALSRSGSESNT
jgi:hypothetical protein